MTVTYLTMQLTEIKPILLSNTWFRDLPDDVIDSLVSMCRPKELIAGHCLHLKGEPADGLYCVLSGRIRISNVSQNGKESVLTWLEPGSWFGEISLFDGLPRTHGAHAEVPSLIMVLPESSFQQLLKQRPDLYPYFMKLLCQRIRATFSLIDETSCLPLKGQLAKRLLLLGESFGQREQDIIKLNISVSQESLALMLHTSRQTVNKLLGELQQEGLIQLQYNRISIIDDNGLATLATV